MQITGWMDEWTDGWINLAYQLGCMYVYVVYHRWQVSNVEMLYLLLLLPLLMMMMIRHIATTPLRNKLNYDVLPSCQPIFPSLTLLTMKN